MGLIPVGRLVRYLTRRECQRGLGEVDLVVAQTRAASQCKVGFGGHRYAQRLAAGLLFWGFPPGVAMRRGSSIMITWLITRFTLGMSRAT